jgi:hypothetical protein
MSGGDVNAQLFAVFKGQQSKETVFASILGQLESFEAEVAEQTSES